MYYLPKEGRETKTITGSNRNRGYGYDCVHSVADGGASGGGADDGAADADAGRGSPTQRDRPQQIFALI